MSNIHPNVVGHPVWWAKILNMNSALRPPCVYEGIEYMTLFYVPLSPKALVHNRYSYGAISLFIASSVAQKAASCSPPYSTATTGLSVPFGGIAGSPSG